VARLLVLTLLFGGAALGAVLVARHVLREPVPRKRPPRRRTRLADVADVDGGPEVLRAMPDRWWTRRAPAGAKLCYASKTDALNKFREWNQQVIDEYGGETAGGSRGEFDALTRHGALPKNIAEALWLALPPERTHYGRGPFCLEDIDVEALNETSAGQNHPTGFTLPEYVSEKLIDRKYEEHYRDEV
jgi:hypothetical protein